MICRKDKIDCMKDTNCHMTKVKCNYDIEYRWELFETYGLCSLFSVYSKVRLEGDIWKVLSLIK